MIGGQMCVSSGTGTTCSRHQCVKFGAFGMRRPLLRPMHLRLRLFGFAPSGYSCHFSAFLSDFSVAALRFWCCGGFSGLSHLAGSGTSLTSEHCLLMKLL